MSGTIVSPWPPRTIAWMSRTDTSSASDRNVRYRAVSSTPAMPITRSRGKPVTCFVTQHMTSGGFETTTTVILLGMVRGKLTRVGQVTKGVQERLESLRDVPGAARQEIALERGERPLAERGLGAIGERRKRVACRKRPAGGGVLRGVLEDVRKGLACSPTGTCRSQTYGTEPVTQPVE